jgi:two-component system, NarL family, response regulator NreC
MSDGSQVKTVKIIIADDHAVVRIGLRTLLEKEADFQVIGEASDGSQTINLVTLLNPDVVILDMIMPGINGIEITRQIKKISPDTQVIILSMHANEAYVLETLKKGASGYVLKDSTGSDLVKAIREVIAGRRYLSPPLSERALERYIQISKNTGLDVNEALTEREREVLYLAAEGFSNAEIAEKLSISQRTAETHRFNLMHKLGLKNNAELIHYAIQQGIITVKH